MGKGGQKILEKKLILFDWLSFTSSIDSPESIKHFLGLSHLPWNSHSGHRLYHDCDTFGEINICYNSDLNPGVWVEMSGQGCRQFEEYSSLGFYNLFKSLLEDFDSKFYHISRIDLACDIFDKTILDIHKVKRYTDNLNFTSRFKSICPYYDVLDDSLTIYYGRKSSDLYMRVYDKQKERERDDIDYWIRWEIVLKNNHALSFLKKWISDSSDLGDYFSGVVNYYIQYRQPSVDSHKDRWKICPWWQRFIDTVQEIKVYTPKDTVYNLSKCEDYVYKQCGNAVTTLINIKGVDVFLHELVQNKSRTSQKYQQLLSDNNASNDGIYNYLLNRGAL